MREPICFYGDDFTGAAANLLEFHCRGLRGVLFVDTPSAAQLTAYRGNADVIGIAGVSRSLAPAAMEREVRPAFELFRTMGARLIQYKICATFDSSPVRGNFGTVLELARTLFGTRTIPIVPAHPDFGRYTVFGNHFSVYQGSVFRLDRHPSMANHPATPMHEADLRRHLAAQTALPIALCDLPSLRAASDGALDDLLASSDAAATVFDAIERRDLVTVARAVWRASRQQPLFTLSAHGFAAGLGSHLAELGETGTVSHAPQKPVESLVVLSGSCSPRTASQIAYAQAHGWRTLRLPVEKFGTQDETQVVEQLVAEILDALAARRSIIVYAAAGPDDASIAAGRSVFDSMASESSAVIGAVYGAVLRRVVASRRLPRVVLAGGDTSSQTMRRLGVDALTIDAVNTATNEAFMRVRAQGSPFDGMQVLLKAGQNGTDDYLGRALEGDGWV
ncbi:four-carbon acid sugar kinase family protein [Paraburkholderia sp. RL17-337-BIB-A]|uniref:four-carbon acid sugar kinase family protein n=1 Tax=Paraburkholderia sp. RL17-337-BIB-A TaxID=3031636 RepID=UPI0038BA7749